MAASRCTICARPDREEIDHRIAAGEANTVIARDLGVSEATIRRHVKHVAANIAASHQADALRRGDDLLGQICTFLTRTVAILERAEKDGTYNEQCNAAREVRGAFTLLAKVSGEIDTGPTVNIIQSPEWVAVRSAIFLALEPYPDARRAVADALAEVDA